MSLPVAVPFVPDVAPLSLAGGVIPDVASSSAAAVITPAARASLKPGMAEILSTDALDRPATLLMPCSDSAAAAAGPIPGISIISGFMLFSP